MKRAFKIAAYAAASILLILAVLAGLTQTSFFKERLRAMLVSAVADQINGTLVIGTIDGNFITGVTIDSVAILDNGAPVAAAGRITISYDLLRFLRGEYDIREAVVDRPVLHLRRGSSGKWNIERMFKPSTDTSSGSFSGTLFLPDVQLKNGTVTLFDSAHPGLPPGATGPRINYGNFSIRGLNLQASGTLRANDVSLSIPHMSFYSPESGFELTLFRGKFRADGKGASVRDVVLQTSRSYVELDASLSGADLFKGIELSALGGDSAQVRLKASNVDLGELQSFLPELGFLKGSAALELEAGGEFGNLTVRHLNLRTYESSVNLSGTIRNLHDPQNLTLDVIGGDTRILLSDLSQLMPDFRIPAFTRTGSAAVYLEFNGKPLDFKAVASLKGAFGSVDVRGSLDLTRARPSYNAAFAAERLSIEDLTGDPAVQGSITARGTISGEGFTIGDLAGTLDAQIDTSRINNLALTSSRIRIDADGNIVKIASTLRDQEMALDFRGTTDWSDPDRPHVSGELDLQNINLATVLGDPRLESAITLRGSVRGQGGGVDDASGTLELRLLPSMIGGHELPAQEVRFTLDQHDRANKHLTLSSEIADIDIAGSFDLDLASAALARQSANLIRAIREHALPPDSVLARSDARPPDARRASGEPPRAMDFTYVLHIKDLGSVSTVVDARQFDAKANLAGSVRGTEDRLSFSCNGTIHHFFVGKIDSGIIFNDANISLEAGPISLDETLERLSGTLYLNIGSCFAGGRTIDSVRIGLQYDQMRGNFSVSGTIDSVNAVALDGQTSVQPGTYVFDVENLLVGRGAREWRNNQDVQVRVNSEGIRVLHAVMEHAGEQLTVSGVLRQSGEFDMEAALRNYNLRGINSYIRDLQRAQEGQGFAGHADATLLLAGTTASPRITFRLATDSTYFRRSRIGQVTASIVYADELATIDITANEAEKDTVPDLAIRGTVPINLAFSGVERRFPDREQHLSVRSEGFDVSVLDPLIWELDRLSGKLTCNVKVGGTPRLPDYRGTISLHGLKFLFMPNNVAYQADGELEPSGDKLLLKNLVVKNVPEDRVPGEARFEGSISIKDYAFNTFDITMYGKLLVMSDASRKIIPTMYGTLFAAPDAKGLNLSGTLARPFLSGNLEVLDANIIFPPARIYDAGAPAQITSLSYVVVDDTTMKRNAPLRFPKNFYASPDSGVFTVAQRTSADEPALLDRLRYNLVIETKGTTAVKMIFTPNEELYAEMEGKVSAINDQGTALIYGEVAISSRSYYNFLKKFDATGNIKFVGPWDNPELNIVATYEGYRQGRSSESDPAGSAGKDLKTVVTLDIGGTRYEPKLKMSMKVQLTPNGELTDWASTAGGGDVQSDAISFIVTGKFREDLTSGERAGLAADVGASTTTTVVSGFTSNLLSGILDNFVRKEFPFIRSVDVSYQGGSPRVNVGASPGLGYLRVGGMILNSINNTNVSYQVSMGDIFNSTTIRNLFLEIQRRVENDLTGTNREDVTNEARLYYRFSF